MKLNDVVTKLITEITSRMNIKVIKAVLDGGFLALLMFLMAFYLILLHLRLCDLFGM